MKPFKETQKKLWVPEEPPPYSSPLTFILMGNYLHPKITTTPLMGHSETHSHTHNHTHGYPRKSAHRQTHKCILTCRNIHPPSTALSLTVTLSPSTSTCKHTCNFTPNAQTCYTHAHTCTLHAFPRARQKTQSHIPTPTPEQSHTHKSPRVGHSCAHITPGPHAALTSSPSTPLHASLF